MNDHMHIHSIDGTCVICGEVNSRVRASWRLSHPTPPTQEKELPKCSRDEKMMICYCGKCKPEDYPLPADFSTLKDLVDNSVTEITVETPDGWKCLRKNCNADYLHTHGDNQRYCTERCSNTCKFHSTKPTQDTESWESSFDREFSAKLLEYENGSVIPSNGNIKIKIRDFIKQKKQEWQKLENELVAILMNHCGECGDNEGAVETLQRIIRERDTARTQGAEAAVKYIQDNADTDTATHKCSHVMDAVLEEAKKV